MTQTINLGSPGTFLQAVGLPGQIIEAEDYNIESRTNENALPIPFGFPVIKGAADTTCKISTANTDVIIGFAARHVIGVGADQYNQKDEVPIVQAGEMLIPMTEAWIDGDTLIAIYGGTTAVMGSKSTGAAGSSRIVVPNCVLRGSGVIGGLARAHLFG